MIPPEVLERLRELAAGDDDPLGGGFTTRQLAAALGRSQPIARDRLREWMAEGLLEQRIVGLTNEQAAAAGYLGGTSIAVYYLVDD